MKVKVIYIGKEKKNFFSAQEELYLSRIKHYISIELLRIPAPKRSSSLSIDEVKASEEKLFLKHINASAQTILLDEGGKSLNSLGFSKLLEQKMNSGSKELNFIIGGAYGFSREMKKNYSQVISLSPLTFAHHLARLVLLEQIYRGFTIINNEPYHNN